MEGKKQTTEHQKKQTATEIMKSELRDGRKQGKWNTTETCENSMEQNEAEMKSEERNSDREEEIEPRAHLCENSIGRNEAEMKVKTRVVTGKKKQNWKCKFVKTQWNRMKH